MKRVVIAGASGFTGNKILHLMLQDRAYEKVYVLVRRYLDFHHQKLEQIIVNYDNLNDEIFPNEIDEAFCCLGTTIKKAQTHENFRRVDYEYITRFAKLCEKKGVKTFHLISAVGANPRSLFFYQKVKGEAELFASSLDIPTVVIYRPSVIYGDREEFRLGESMAAWVSRYLGFLFFGPMKRMRAISGDQLAAAMMETARTPQSGRIILESEEILARSAPIAGIEQEN